MPRAARNLTGEQFGLLTACWPVGRDRKGNLYWSAMCDCGGRTTIRATNWGRVKSCGCLLKENGRTTHGMSHSSTYRSYQDARNRCLNKNCADYPEWGGRGIRFEFDSFEHFLSVMHERPAGTTLDRYPDPNGPYSPTNCRWADAKQQAQNRRPRRKKVKLYPFTEADIYMTKAGNEQEQAIIEP